VFSSSGGYSRFGGFIFRWLQPFRWLHLQVITATSVASSSGGYSRFGAFIFRWLQPFRCLHLQMVTAVSVPSSSGGYSRFGVFIFRWLQPFRCLHLQVVTAVSVPSSSGGYSRFDFLPTTFSSYLIISRTCSDTGMTSADTVAIKARGGGACFRVSQNVPNTKMFVMGSFGLDYVLLAKGSVLNLFYEIWQYFANSFRTAPGW